jgi:ubiquinone/menaquinone biosynthesis C-methylase UbiE
MDPANIRVFENERTFKNWDDDYYHPIAESYYDETILDTLIMMEAARWANVLDAGCGPGVHAIRIARAGYRVTAIDVSKTMLREAQSRVSAAGIESSIKFHQEDLTKLSFADASFRHVFCWGVIIHIREVERALNELARITEPGGTLALCVSNYNAFDRKLETLIRSLIHRPLKRELYPLGSGIWYEMNDGKLWVWQFKIPELKRQMESRGFHLIGRNTAPGKRSAEERTALSE